MEDSRLKRNIMAIVVAIPLIYFLSILTSLFGHSDFKFWGWDLFFNHHGGDVSSNDSLKRIVDLSGRWSFAPGDDAARAQADFDDSSWSEISVPDYWEDQGYTNHDGFGWYRRHFSLAEDDLDSMLYLELGMIDDTDEVFINGERIGGTGQFPPTYIGAWNQLRRYVIPDGVARKGKNIVAVRVYDAQMGGGIYTGDPGIYASRYPAPLVNLEGEWQFWRDGEESERRTIGVPGIWEHQGHEHYDGIAWYRKEFGPLNVKGEERLILLLGKIDDTDEVTLNGELIGRTGNLNSSDRMIDKDYHRIERHYEFPSSLLKENNVLQVRVHDSGGEGGIYQGPVAILAKSDYSKYKHEKVSD